MFNYQLKDILLESEIHAVKQLLKENELNYEPHVTKTIGLYDNDKLIATGSLDHNVIKMIAVDKTYQSQNLSAKVLSHLLFELESLNVNHYFLFTKPRNKKIFSNFSLNEIIETPDVTLFENNTYDIHNILNHIASKLPKKQNSRGCIVMNLNPMTLGHLYLIEHAAKLHDDLIIFLVETDASIVSYPTRFNILKDTIKHLKNVIILPSTDYIISRATFPTYFIKEDKYANIYATLDISIFKKYFMPIFDIDMRYVGEEPLDPTTHQYNQTMKDILKDQLTIIRRLEKNQKIISASYIRKLAKEKQYDEIKQLVPKATYKFIKSKKGRQLFNE